MKPKAKYTVGDLVCDGKGISYGKVNSRRWDYAWKEWAYVVRFESGDSILYAESGLRPAAPPTEWDQERI